MVRLLTCFVVSILLVALPHIGFSQKAGPETDTRACENPDLRQNPLLDSANRVAPEILPNLVIRLKRIGCSPRQGTLRGDDRPTPAEELQLAANPAFARAYRNEPAQALHLLRSVNAILSKSAR
jgi:hypothetical protein